MAKEAKGQYINGEAIYYRDDNTRKMVSQDAFSVTNAYSVGDYCIYENTLYKFIADKTMGSWDASVVEAVTVTGELENLKDDLLGLHDTLYDTLMAKDIVSDLLAEAEKGLQARRIVRTSDNTLNTPYTAGLTGTFIAGFAYINMVSNVYGQVVYHVAGDTNIFVNKCRNGTWGGWENIKSPAVGDIYTTSTATNPSSYLGGTWTCIDKRFTSKYFQPTDVVTINTTNCSACSSYFMFSGNTIKIRLHFTTAVKLADDAIELGTIDFSKIGITNLTYSPQFVGQSDGGNGVVIGNINNSTGVVTINDIILKGSGTSMAAEVNVIIDLTLPILQSAMINSWCNQFIWKRTA